MNNENDSRFPTVGTIVTDLTVCGLAVACALAVVVSGIPPVVA